MLCTGHDSKNGFERIYAWMNEWMNGRNSSTIPATIN